MGFEFELMQFISSFSLVSRTSSILVLLFCWVLIFSAAKRVCLNIINRARLFYLFTLIMNYVGVSWFSMEYVWFKYITMGKVLKFQIRFWLYFIKFSFPLYYLWPVFIWPIFFIALWLFWLCTFRFSKIIY